MWLDLHQDPSTGLKQRKTTDRAKKAKSLQLFAKPLSGQMFAAHFSSDLVGHPPCMLDQ
jgi:hypothetical protein